MNFKAAEKANFTVAKLEIISLVTKLVYFATNVVLKQKKNNILELSSEAIGSLTFMTDIPKAISKNCILRTFPRGGLTNLYLATETDA